MGMAGFVRPIAHKVVGSHLWVVEQRFRQDTGEVGETYIVLHLLESQRGFGWGSKSMTEEMGPYTYTCPLAFLDMAPVANEEWRKSVVAYHARSAQIKDLVQSLVPGQWVDLVDRCKPARVQIVSVGRSTIVGTLDGQTYRVSKRLLKVKDQ
jgi:hypothetical protein